MDVVGVDVEVSFSLQLCQTLPNLPLRLHTSEPLPSCLLPRMGRQVLKGDIEFAISSIMAKLGESCAGQQGKVGDQKYLRDQHFELRVCAANLQDISPLQYLNLQQGKRPSSTLQHEVIAHNNIPSVDATQALHLIL